MPCPRCMSDTPAVRLSVLTGNGPWQPCTDPWHDGTRIVACPSCDSPDTRYRRLIGPAPDGWCANPWHENAAPTRLEPAVCEWTFYDRRRAYPTNHSEPDVVDELVVTLTGPNCDTTGEFLITWHKYGSAAPAPRIEVFSESWAAFCDSTMPAVMMLHAGADVTIAQMRETLTEFGYHDRTDEIRAGHASTAGNCPTCGSRLPHLPPDVSRVPS